MLPSTYGKWLAQATGRDTTLLESLTRNSQVLHEIGRDFETSYSNADLDCFYEENKSFLGVKVCMQLSSLLFKSYSENGFFGLVRYITVSAFEYITGYLFLPS